MASFWANAILAKLTLQAGPSSLGDFASSSFAGAESLGIYTTMASTFTSSLISSFG